MVHQPYISCGVELATCVELRVLGRPHSAENFEHFGNAFHGRYVQLLITRGRGKVRDEESVGQIVDEKFEQWRVGVRPSPAPAPSLVAGPPATNYVQAFLCRRHERWLFKRLRSGNTPTKGSSHDHAFSGTCVKTSAICGIYIVGRRLVAFVRKSSIKCHNVQ
jgi:hypothetical protein